MAETNLPEARFEENRATRRFPIPVVKYAVLVPIPHEFPTFIQPEWDEDGTNPQVFYGDYYLILKDDGRGRYGSARVQWENMHRSLPLDRVIAGMPATAWVKVLIPWGYHVDEACRLVTLIPAEDGSVRESSKELAPGTLVIRQPGGEFQFVNPRNESKIYYSAEQAEELGIDQMDDEEFARWAEAMALEELTACVR